MHREMTMGSEDASGQKHQEQAQMQSRLHGEPCVQQEQSYGQHQKFLPAHDPRAWATPPPVCV